MMAERPPSAIPVERVRGERPETADWRADGVARSRHSRLADALVRPLDDHDTTRAEGICGEICRRALLDLAPALTLLPGAERRRAQTLGAFALVLFDFATQGGLEGDRLAELNRWEFQLEEALDGRPAGQPIFVLMAREEKRRPWPRPGLDGLLAAARRRALKSREAAPTETEERTLAAALVEMLLGTGAPAGATDVARLGITLGGSFHGRVRTATPLESVTVPPGLPPGWRRVARYLVLCGRRLGSGPQVAARPQIGLGGRLLLLLRARLPGNGARP